MTITEILYYLDLHDIDCWVVDGEVYLDTNNSIPLPNIDEIKKNLKLRILNNEFAKSRGWLVAHFGEVYQYQYSLNGHLLIERNPDETVDVYRCRFDVSGKATHIKGLSEGIPFSEAYQKAHAFLDWFYLNKPQLTRRRY
ncbi:hypothetical protein J7I80_05840 [Bacillus sp. ISL-41]|uniref:hypothetical protein n=1 Tax=Bacillus sp. ISL-41 TaxID=2819127 RepID=UPI001BEA2521|nr:hypothetical protein [Bacillus sp. ISL-41]MBT2641737.1 hypothetical protein [Bacillus sp. ISL-41]